MRFWCQGLGRCSLTSNEALKAKLSLCNILYSTTAQAAEGSHVLNCALQPDTFLIGSRVEPFTIKSRATSSVNCPWPKCWDDAGGSWDGGMRLRFLSWQSWWQEQYCSVYLIYWYCKRACRDDRCVCSVFSKERDELKLNLRRSNMLMRPTCSLAIFSKDITFQLSWGREEQQRETAVLSGTVSHFYTFFYFQCKISIHIPLCWQFEKIKILLACILWSLILIWSCLLCFREKEKSLRVIVPHASWTVETLHLSLAASLSNSFCLKCVKHVGRFQIVLKRQQ